MTCEAPSVPLPPKALRRWMRPRPWSVRSLRGSLPARRSKRRSRCAPLERAASGSCSTGWRERHSLDEAETSRWILHALRGLPISVSRAASHQAHAVRDGPLRGACWKNARRLARSPQPGQDGRDRHGIERLCDRTLRWRRAARVVRNVRAVIQPTRRAGDIERLCEKVCRAALQGAYREPVSWRFGAERVDRNYVRLMQICSSAELSRAGHARRAHHRRGATPGCRCRHRAAGFEFRCSTAPARSRAPVCGTGIRCACTCLCSLYPIHAPLGRAPAISVPGPKLVRG